MFAFSMNFLRLLFTLYHVSCVLQLLLKNFMMVIIIMMMMMSVLRPYLQYLFYKRHSCSIVRPSYFVVRVTNAWNDLPVDRVDLSSFVVFKRTVQQIRVVHRLGRPTGWVGLGRDF